MRFDILEEKVDNLGTKLDRLVTVVIGDGINGSVVTRLILLENQAVRDKQTIERNQAKIAELEQLRNRLLGGMAVLAFLAGSGGALLMKLLG